MAFGFGFRVYIGLLAEESKPDAVKSVPTNVIVYPPMLKQIAKYLNSSNLVPLFVQHVQPHCRDPLTTGRSQPHDVS